MSSSLHSAQKVLTQFTRPLAMLALVVVSAALAAGVGASPANAFTASNSGCPGTVQVPQTRGYYGLQEFPQRFAWRSACYANYTQVIKIRYRTWGFNLVTRRWEFAGELWREARSEPGSAGAWLQGFNGLPRYANVSVDVLVEWRLTNGYLVGSTYVDYNAVSDYVCVQTPSCRIYSDPVVGAYLHF